MIDHRTARRLAASRVDGALDAADQRALAEHLAECVACRGVVEGYRRDAAGLEALVPIMAPATLRATVLALPDRGLARDLRPWPQIVVAALLLLAVLGAVGYAASQILKTEPVPPVELRRAINWQTEVVSLQANELVIDAGGRRFTGVGQAISVHSDPGDLTYWSLELEWFEQGLEQRLYLYFAADPTSWWISEIRTYDGVTTGGTEWAAYPRGSYARTPIGATWTGDLDVAGVGRAGPVHLHVGDVILRVGPKVGFAAPADGGVVLAPGSTPFSADGPLHCSGILQMTPAVAHRTLLELGYRVSWRAVTAALGEWRAQVEPPDGVIADYTPIVGMDGAIVIAVFPFDHPEASVVPVAADCPPSP